jgi:hypothetical protein
MPAKKLIIIMLSVTIGIILAGSALWFFFTSHQKEFRLIPREKTVVETGKTSAAEVGTGWSVKEGPEALQEAVAMAMPGKHHQPPDFAVVFASSGSDLTAILAEARKIWGDKTKIYGGTSDSRAVMTNKGFIQVYKQGAPIPPGRKGLALMTVTSRDIVFGVGSANFSAYPSVPEASKAAVLQAINHAGRTPQEIPQAILLTITRGAEEEALEGISAVVGQEALVLGGTTGGPQFGVFGAHDVYREGISLAVIYTKLPVGWVFEGGFDMVDTPSGVVTKVEGQAIVEIDHRPALEVYDEWLGGKIKKLVAEVGDERAIKDLLTLHPFYRQYTSANGQDYFLFSHPWPKDKTFKDMSIMTSNKVKVGERIHLSHGTWERLINRIGNLPIIARGRGGLGADKPPILGIGYLCAGVMGAIPEDEREKMAWLINYANQDAPFIAAFSWGEQGHFPGIAAKHGNLLTSFLVIGPKE